jgi:hypothetical protein
VQVLLGAALATDSETAERVLLGWHAAMLLPWLVQPEVATIPLLAALLPVQVLLGAPLETASEIAVSVLLGALGTTDRETAPQVEDGALGPTDKLSAARVLLGALGPKASEIAGQVEDGAIVAVLPELAA